MPKLGHCTLLAAVLLAGSAFPVLAGGAQLPPCTCRLFGESMPLGTRVCMKTPNGPREAVCALEQNVTSWRTGPNLCNEANSSPRLTPPV